MNKEKPKNEVHKAVRILSKKAENMLEYNFLKERSMEKNPFARATTFHATSDPGYKNPKIRKEFERLKARVTRSSRTGKIPQLFLILGLGFSMLTLNSSSYNKTKYPQNSIDYSENSGYQNF